MAEEDTEDIKKYLGILSEDFQHFQHKVNIAIDSLSGKIESTEERLNNKIDSAEKRLNGKFDSLKDELIAHRDSTEAHAQKVRPKKRA